MTGIESKNNNEIISNEEQVNNSLKLFESWLELQLENKEALLILNKIDKYVETDIDLVYDKENNMYKLLANNETFSDFLTIKQLRITEKILEAYYNNDFNPGNNSFKLIEEKRSIEVEWRMTDEWKKLLKDGREIHNWEVDFYKIDITNSDNRNIIADLMDDNLTVLTELWDEELPMYVDFLNKFIKK